jgi:hypothetical protein
MNRSLAFPFVFVALLVIADHSRSLLQHSFGLDLPYSPAGLVLAYVLPFALTGALIALMVSRKTIGIFFAFGLGIAVAAMHAAFDGIRPTLTYSHAPLWLEVLGWANLYMPAVGSTLGACVVSIARAARKREPNAV